MAKHFLRPERVSVQQSEPFKGLLRKIYDCRKNVPGQLVIQMTDRCNARCPQCGMRVTEANKRSTLTDGDIFRVIDSAVDKGIEVLSFTGGEPLLYAEKLFGYIRYAGKAGIKYIRTGTNGFVFTNPEKAGFKKRITKMAESLADSSVRNFWISIDSAVPERHEKMRGFKGVIKGIEQAVPVFHSHGVYPSVNLGINRNMGADILTPLSPNAGDREKQKFYKDCKKAFLLFFNRVIDMGFTIANVCYPMSMAENRAPDRATPVYSATSSNVVVKFAANEKVYLFKALRDVIPAIRPRIRAFTPLCALHSLERYYRNYGDIDSGYPCRGGIDFFFISAKDGNTYPCGYRGNENLGKFWAMRQLPVQKDTRGCNQCDWECFRDPSELFGPLLSGWSHPLGLAKKMAKDRDFFRLWVQDLKYYRDCDFFDGRVAFNMEK